MNKTLVYKIRGNFQKDPCPWVCELANGRRFHAKTWNDAIAVALHQRRRA